MRKRRAVLIDDEEIVVNMFKDFFSTRRYEVLSYTRPVVCPFPDENRYLCNTNYPCADVIITDINMSGMNGLELLQEQSRRGCKLKNENKAVLSKYLDEESCRKINQLGYAFFHKPIDLSKFLAWLDECEKRVDLSQRLASRRRERRHVTHYDVQCLFGSTGETVNGITVNISNSGLCLKLMVPPRTNQIIHIRTIHTLMACDTASVRWVSRNPDGSYLAGLSCD
jgi:response regulator RpfG family c-di-GMP phosphodiesterase